MDGWMAIKNNLWMWQEARTWNIPKKYNIQILKYQKNSKFHTKGFTTAVRPNHSLISQSRVLVVELVRIPTFYGTKRFITVLRRAWHRILSWARLIHSTPSNPISVIYPIYASLPNGLPFRSSDKTLYTFLISATSVTCHQNHSPWTAKHSTW
jgi:hypothetical protein